MPPATPTHDDRRFKLAVRASIIAMSIAAAIAVLLRIAAGLGGLDPTWDEPLMQPIIERIVDGGWTVENTIDFDDTKGPAFFILYAAGAEIIGAETERLRLLSIVFFVASVGVLAFLVRVLGFDDRRTGLITALFLLLPYHLILSQLFMSEPSFILGGLALMATALWGFGLLGDREHPVAGPALCGLLLVVLLHHRVHAVVYAAAIALVALDHLRWRAWTWWLTLGIAGLLRLPLVLRWDGLVGPSYQDRYGLGLRLESLAYLAAALLPYLGCLLVAVWLRSGTETRFARRCSLAGLLVGIGLGVLSAVDGSPFAQTPDPNAGRYLGMIATLIAVFGDRPALATGVAVALAGLGVASIGATVGLLRNHPRPRDATMIAERLGVATALVGWALYALTRGDVFDRYLMPFAILIPLLWARVLPRWLIVIQTIALLTLSVVSIVRWT
ncbi:MAG: hypothetical protein ACF8PN_01950 [Phycisphaerales bacterium]